MANEEEYKVGDIYEDCCFHPCLCTEVDEEGISGISLIDGTSPRSCSLVHCGIRKLSIEEATEIKENGPKDDFFRSNVLPDKQWWWPKPRTATNPGNNAKSFFESSLRFLRNDKLVTNLLGKPIIGWFEPEYTFLDIQNDKYARASFVVRGKIMSAKVHIRASKEGRLWPIQSIRVEPENTDEVLEFTGKAVRGCGVAI